MRLNQHMRPIVGYDLGKTHEWLYNYKILSQQAKQKQ